MEQVVKYFSPNQKRRISIRKDENGQVVITDTSRPKEKEHAEKSN